MSVHLNGKAVAGDHKPKQHGHTAELPEMLSGSGMQSEATGHAGTSDVAEHVSSPAEKVMCHPFWQQTNVPTQQGVFLPQWVMTVVTEGTEMLVLGQLNFWFRLSDKSLRLRASVSFNGHVWVAKSYAELGEVVIRSERQIQTAVKNLKEKGFVVVQPRRSKFHGECVVSHFRLNWDVIGCAVENAVTKKGDTLGEELL